MELVFDCEPPETDPAEADDDAFDEPACGDAPCGGHLEEHLPDDCFDPAVSTAVQTEIAEPCGLGPSVALNQLRQECIMEAMKAAPARGTSQ
ncbi:hypothetical protein WJX73_003538 [Symbiochloris irregularis]|uniref:Uncharacterized protein n=1 Tax=Symbiochloris irregularis TaxID=706552 RepID=A0AAW1NP97_9CHLO